MSYEEKKHRAIKSLQNHKSKGKISLKPKFTSHFFRTRQKKNKLDLTYFNKVIKVDAKNKVVEVEGLCTFYDLTKEALRQNLLPVIVPEFRNITIGGAIAGLGLESSSFKYGMVHNSIIECDVLTSTGEVVTCSRTKNRDLFYLLPNSIGSVGYILKCKFKLRSAKKYVKINFIRYENSKDYFRNLKSECIAKDADFIDGIIFSKNHFVIIKGKLTDTLPKNEQTKNFKLIPYWKFIKNNPDGLIYMTTWDYLWRWDSDVFWSISVGWMRKISENKIFRFTVGRYILRSHILGKLNHLKREYFVAQKNEKEEKILQDVGIDIDKCAKFFDWYDKEVSVYPTWICPTLNTEGKGKYVLHNLDVKYLVDIGIYTSKIKKKGEKENYYNRLLEKKVIELKGNKGLYSENFFTSDEFWKLYNKNRYFKLKNKYDPENLFPDIYEKTISNK